MVKQFSFFFLFEFCIFELVLIPKPSLNGQFWLFGPNVWTKLNISVIPIKNRKIEHHHWILYIRISLGTKFPNELTILIFWTKFLQKGYSHSTTKKVNITLQLWLFGPNLPKTGACGGNRKQWTSQLNSGYSN